MEGRTVADFLHIFDMDQVEVTDSILEVAEKLKDYLFYEYSNYRVAFYLAGFDHDVPFVFLVNSLSTKSSSLMN
ncbi:hypothetical protein V7075_03280 [Neobacillus drentensis]|uniref:hypothetical protein n=1 Tax=Neobacillus drentensis TaxID=220684 RepID=UPI002FFF06AC